MLIGFEFSGRQISSLTSELSRAHIRASSYVDFAMSAVHVAEVVNDPSDENKGRLLGSVVEATYGAYTTFGAVVLAEQLAEVAAGTLLAAYISPIVVVAAGAWAASEAYDSTFKEPVNNFLSKEVVPRATKSYLMDKIVGVQNRALLALGDAERQITNLLLTAPGP
jgi:hypothetical protein